jgi:hypothetical protein
VKSLPGFWDYVTSSSFGSHLLENWQSEFLQFFVFIGITVWFVQQGSSEGKPPGDEGTEGDMPRGLRGKARGNGLLLVMLACFIATWGSQSVASWREFNEDQLMHNSSGVSWSSYVHSADFWERTLQNWQSEFLAVAAMSIFTVYLRQVGSPESKRIDTPHEQNEPTY